MAGRGITPNRKTRVTFDVAETICVSPLQGYRRRGAEIAQERAAGATDAARFVNVKLWPTGCYTLDPIQSEISNLQEYTIFRQHIIAPDNPSLITQLVYIATLAVENTYRQDTDLPGMGYSGNINAVGAPYIVRKVAAGGTYNESIPSGTPNVLSGPDGTSVPDVPVDRVIESIASYPPNQGFFINWGNPGTRISYPGAYFCFYFGQYCVSFTGSGKAILSEQIAFTNGLGTGWKERAAWKYARTGQVSQTAHSMGIWPHKGPSGQQYIAFSNGQVDFAQVTTSFAATAAAVSTAPGDFIYTVKADPYSGHSPTSDITISAPMRADMRRNWKMAVQFSTLGWPTNGLIVDAPGSFAPDSTSLEASAYPLQLYVDAVALPGTGITGQLINAEDGATYDNRIHTHPAAKFVFFGDGNSTPQLWGYSVHRDSVSNVSAPGAFAGGTLRSVSVTGYNGDPTQSSAHVNIADLKNELPRLRNRGLFRARIDVDHTENGQVFTTPIFQGYAVRPTGTRRRKQGRVYPSPDWHDFDVPFQGMWTRLAEPTSGPVAENLFYSDPAVPISQRGGLSFVPWKVTDAIRYLISCAGFAPNQINIPDFPIRLWTSAADPAETFKIQANTQYSDLIQNYCRNYLGGYLCYDEAGDFWTILQGTDLAAPPIYAFVTSSPDEHHVSTERGAYGPRTTFITDLHIEPVPAEYNMVHVMCPLLEGTGVKSVFEAWRFNHYSYHVPGSSILPNPDHPDYIGHFRPCVIVDSSLGMQIGSSSSSAEATQAAVDYTCNRLYDLCAHGQKLTHFTAPLAFVVDPMTNLWRMLRFQDPIAINGQPYILKSCVPNYTLDSVQMASYEAIQPIAGQYIPPGMDALSFQRTAERKTQARHAGSATDSNRLGTLGVAPHAEGKYDHLPRNTFYQRPLQDPQTGDPYFQMGYSTLGNAPLP